MKMLDYALAYAARDWAVFPLHTIDGGQCTCGKDNCNAKGKHPLHSGGFKIATTDTQTIRDWWELDEDANIGIATGRISGLLVVDIDIGSNKNGLDSLQKLEVDFGPLPRDLVVRTGGGGFHHYLQMPAQPVSGSVSKIGLHIDVRADGGYVVAPPSRHISGNLYTWENSFA